MLFSSLPVIAVIPIVPALNALGAIIIGLLAGLVTLLGVTGTRDQRQRVRRFLMRQTPSLLVIGGGLGILCAAAVWWPSTETRHGAHGGGGVGSGQFPVYRGNPGRTGAVEGTASPRHGGVIRRSGRRDHYLASPAVAGDELFCIGNRGDEGRIWCRDAKTGVLRWQSRPERMRATFSSPVVTEDYLVCGEGLHHTNNARVFCLDRRPGREGELVWSFVTNGHVEGTPWVDGNQVFVTAGDDGIYALSLTAVADDERVLWHVPGSRFPDVETCLAVDDRTVYVGLGAGGNAICFLDRDTGEELSRLPMPYPVHAPPAIAGNRIFFGMGTGDYVNYAANGGGEVVCVDRRTRTVLWRFPTQGVILGAIAADGGEVIAASADGTVTVLDEEGSLRNQWTAPAAILAAPAVTNTMIYVCDESGRLTGLDRDRLVPVWEVQLGNWGRFVSSPVVAHGHVYVGTEQHGFVCAGESAAPIPPKAVTWNQQAGSNSVEQAVIPLRGKLRWQVAVDGGGPRAMAVAEDVIVIAGHRQSTDALSNGPAGWLAGWRLPDGDEPAVPLFLRNDNDRTTFISVTGDHIICRQQRDEAGPAARLACFERIGGALVWEQSIPAHTVHPCVDAGIVYAQADERSVATWECDGGRLWTKPLGRLVAPPITIGRILLSAAVSSTGDDRITMTASDRDNGQELWHREHTLIAGKANSGDVRLWVHDRDAATGVLDRFFVWDGFALTVRSLVDGTLLETREIVDPGDVAVPVTEWQFRSPWLVGMSAAGALRYSSLNDLPGEPSCVDGQFDSVMAVGRNAMLCGSGRSVRRIVFAGSVDDVWWEAPAEMGTITAGVFSEGRLFAVTDSGRLLCLEGASSR